jgi:hypothetical protein
MGENSAWQTSFLLLDIGLEFSVSDTLTGLFDDSPIHRIAAEIYSPCTEHASPEFLESYDKIDTYLRISLSACANGHKSHTLISSFSSNNTARTVYACLLHLCKQGA